jgi:hypothetical protein
METGEPAPGDDGMAPGDDGTGAGGDGEITAPQGARAEREPEREKIRGRTLSVEEISEVLRHGGRISRLGAEDKRRVDELIGQGEQALRDGDYFKAERRFLQAQDLTRANPLVEVGIAHSQLGAGLYLSASLTLRNLFLENPELIDAVYDPALLPPPARLARVVAMIRNRIDLGEDRSGYGLLLAYIGHQTADRAMVEEGLALVGGTPSLDASRELLQGVWLGER